MISSDEEPIKIKEGRAIKINKKHDCFNGILLKFMLR